MASQIYEKALYTVKLKIINWSDLLSTFNRCIFQDGCLWFFSAISKEIKSNILEFALTKHLFPLKSHPISVWFLCVLYITLLYETIQKYVQKNTTGIFKISYYSVDIFHEIIYFLWTSFCLTSFWLFCLLPYLFTILINDSHIKKPDISIKLLI